jgi:predicted methyltransferase
MQSKDCANSACVPQSPQDLACASRPYFARRRSGRLLAHYTAICSAVKILRDQCVAGAGLLVIVALLQSGCAGAPSPSRKSALVDGSDLAIPASVYTVLTASDRSAADRALDAGRKPAEMLTFFGIRRGMHVAELGAGGGYTAELLARLVGPAGVVYGQNSQLILDRFASAPWSARLANSAMANVVRVDREFDSPLPPEAKNLDAVLLVLFYHDTVWMNVDRAKMNQAIFAALRPGGVYGVVDHSARPGDGINEVKSLHRIEEKVVRAEIEAAGFKLMSESNFLRNPTDTRDWNDSPSAAAERRGKSDRFVLRFIKPAE